MTDARVGRSSVVLPAMHFAAFSRQISTFQYFQHATLRYRRCAKINTRVLGERGPD